MRKYQRAIAHNLMQLDGIPPRQQAHPRHSFELLLPLLA